MYLYLAGKSKTLFHHIVSSHKTIWYTLKPIQVYVFKLNAI